MPSERRAIEVHTSSRNVCLLLDGQIDKALDALSNRLHLRAQIAEMLKVFAKDLDGQVRATPRQHVVDTMRGRLADGDVDSGQERQLRADVIERLVP